MSYAVRISAKAIPDVQKAYNWYGQEAPGMEDNFLTELQSVVDRIAARPHRFSPVPGRDARYALLKRFPYKIIYQVNEAMQRIEIVAVVHKSRHPRVWKRQII